MELHEIKYQNYQSQNFINLLNKTLYTFVFKAFSKRNNFDVFNQIYKQDQESNHQELVDTITDSNRQNDRLLIFKHHHWFNMRSFDPTKQQPTWLTFTRDPLEMFSSDWSFCRFGSKEKPNGPLSPCREGATKPIFYGLNQCIHEDHKDCMKTRFQYTQALCGTDLDCFAHRFMTADKQRKATEITKKALLMKYSSVFLIDPGCFKKSLLLLEKMFPDYFYGMHRYLKINMDTLVSLKFQSAAINRTVLNHENKKILASGIFRFDMDLYYFIKSSKYANEKKNCRHPGSNQGPSDLQSDALPAEL